MSEANTNDPTNIGVKIQELEDAARPLVEYLHKNGNPHTTIIVTFGNVEVLQSQLTAGFKVPD